MPEPWGEERGAGAGTPSRIPEVWFPWWAIHPTVKSCCGLRWPLS